MTDGSPLLELGALSIGSAATQTTEPFTGLNGLVGLSGSIRFVGTGGTSVDVFIQTSIDGGATWADLCNAHFTASGESLFGLEHGACADLSANDGTLASNTALNNGVVPLFDQYRLKVVSVGTWANGLVSAYAMPSYRQRHRRATYKATAVHFDGSAYLSNLTSVIPNSFVGSFSMWVKLASAQLPFVYNPFFQVASSTQPSFVWDGAQLGGYDDNYFQLGLEIYDLNIPGHGWVGGSGAFYPGGVNGWPSAPHSGSFWSPDTWHHIFCSWNVNAAPFNKTRHVVLDGVECWPQTLPQDPAFYNFDDAGDHAPVQWTDPADGAATQFFVPAAPAATNPPSMILDMADFMFWPDRFIDFTPSNFARFNVGGKPVDPQQAATAFGQPSVMFSGDATHFLVNQGSLGAFTLTGTLTNASSSPSD